jgi:ureidoglycolate lyase
MKLDVKKITPENFADFGVLVAPGDRKPTAELEGMTFWADLASLPDLGKEYGLGYATQAVRPNVQKNAERHMETPELLLSTGGDMVVVVGPPDFPEEPERLPAPERFRAFQVPEGVGVLVKPGVWHWAPFAVSGTVRLLVIFASGTSDSDAVVKDLEPEEYLEFDTPI